MAAPVPAAEGQQPLRQRPQGVGIGGLAQGLGEGLRHSCRGPWIQVSQTCRNQGYVGALSVRYSLLLQPLQQHLLHDLPLLLIQPDCGMQDHRSSVAHWSREHRRSQGLAHEAPPHSCARQPGQPPQRLEPRTVKLSSGAGGQEPIPRNAVMPAPSAEAPRSARMLCNSEAKEPGHVHAEQHQASKHQVDPQRGESYECQPAEHNGQQIPLSSKVCPTYLHDVKTQARR